jgi:DNA-binding transcriptional LysR family regulator
MEMRQLEMFTAVVERKGYQNAGAYLHVSHSAIHRQIRLLEEELNEKLFVRNGRSVELTEAGRLLVVLANRMRQEVASVKQQIRDMQDLISGELRVGTGTTTLIFFLPPILEEFRRKYPGVELYIVTGTADQLVSQIQAGTLDLGLVSEPAVSWSPEKSLCYERLYEEEFSLAVSKKHPLARRKSIKWSDLRDVPLIAFPRTSRIRRLIDGLFEQANIQPKIIMELENEEAIEKMIDLSLGAGFIARRRITGGRLHSLNVGEKSILLNVAGVRRDSYTARRIQEFLRICHRHAATPR